MFAFEGSPSIMQVSLIAHMSVAPEELIVIEELRMDSLARNKCGPGSIMTCREIWPAVLSTSASITASCIPSVALPIEYPQGWGYCALNSIVPPATREMQEPPVIRTTSGVPVPEM